ncbi:MAG: hypothetical protein ACTHOO_09185 [Alcanivorax sp.]
MNKASLNTGILAFTTIMGAFFVVLGAVVFICFSYMFYLVAYHPESFELLQILSSKMMTGENALNISMTYPNAPEGSYEMAIAWSDSLRLVIISFLLIILTFVVISVCTSFISIGSDLLKLSMRNNHKKSSENDDLV